MTQRIAMWSGPRNVSTALMRSFEARGDCAVVDEPLYAAYLAVTGLEHPGRAEILASQPIDPVAALAALQPTSADLPLQFEKHMAQHWQPSWPWHDFGPDVQHAFLIRDPAAVVASYAQVREAPRAEELGALQQVSLLEAAEAAGQSPVVVDGDELRANPEGMLCALCEALGISFTTRMLSWPAGPRAADGVWAPHWYSQVEASTAFAPPRPPKPCPEALRPVVDALRPAYEQLAARRLRA